jgi:uncharacterized membrane protein HdeD (DUF308 family)
MTTATDVLQNNSPTPFLTKMGKGMFWGGIVMLLLGFSAIMMPIFSSLVVEILIGWLLAFSGAFAILGAFSLRGTKLFLWEFVTGLITLTAGVLMLSYPLDGLVALTVLVALIMILTGLAQGAFALWVRPTAGWIWGGLSALISVVLGIYIFAALPEASTVILGLLVGIDFVSTGTALILISKSAAALQRTVSLD